MRHNRRRRPSSSCCVALKRHGMAQAVGELTEQGSRPLRRRMPILSQLLKAETADRRSQRSTAYQLKAARFSLLSRPRRL